MEVSPASVDFGRITPGTSQSQTVTVTNTGDEDLILGALSLGSAPEFALSDNLCDGATLARGASCTFRVTFTPRSTNVVTSAVTLPSNAPSSPSTLALSGGGSAPIPTLSEWARLLLLALLALTGAAVLRRRAIL